MNIEEILGCNIKIANTHSQRLRAGLSKIQIYLPLTGDFVRLMNDDQVAILDMISTRFARLQDLIGSKIFSSILLILGEEVTNYRDNLNKLEKLRILNDASWWRRIRELRNSITHDYPEDSRLFFKPYSESEMLGDFCTQNRSVPIVHEDSSTKSTTQIFSEEEFRKKSDEYLAENFNSLVTESAALLVFWEDLQKKIIELKIL